MQNLMPPINTPDQLFHDGDPTQGIEGTLVTAGYLNNQQGATRDLQQELLNVLGGAHIQPDPKKTDQLLTALRALLLSRKNPFGDIKSDGTVKTALENLGLGEAAKMPAATALASSAGNITIPVLIGGVQRTALLQWKMVSVPQSTDGNMVVVDDSWPVAFPNACLSINPSLVNSVIYATNGAPFVSAAIVDRVKFKAACAYTKSNSTVAVWGVGY